MKTNEILMDAVQHGYAVAAFNSYNYESIAWIIEAAEEEGVPVIAMLYPSCSRYIPISSFAAVTKDLASKVKVPVGLHFDHSRSFQEIMAGIAGGFSSVMIDGSSFVYEENVHITAKVVEAAHAMGIDVEAELGFVGSASVLEDFTDNSRYTDPKLAADFIIRTHVDSLAIAIGSAHGNYAAAPKLDFERLDQIKNMVNVPLVLHGGSGIPDEQVKEAVKRGIRKINIGTELNQAIYQKTKEIMEKGKSNESMLSCLMAVKEKMKVYLRQKLQLLNP